MRSWKLCRRVGALGPFCLTNPIRVLLFHCLLPVLDMSPRLPPCSFSSKKSANLSDRPSLPKLFWAPAPLGRKSPKLCWGPAQLAAQSHASELRPPISPSQRHCYPRSRCCTPHSKVGRRGFPSSPLLTWLLSPPLCWIFERSPTGMLCLPRCGR